MTYRVSKLEFNVAHHCNLRCDHCDHLSPFFSADDADFNRSITVDNFRAQLALLSPHVHSERFLLLGGEPLLQKEILEYLKVLRESGISDKVEMVSNGFLLPHQPDALFKALDKITVSSYSSRPLPQASLELIRTRCAAHKVELEIFDQPRFSMSVVGTENPDPKQVNLIFQTCMVAWRQRCYAIQDGYIYRCSRAPFLGYRLKQQGLIDEDFHKLDGLKIEDRPDFGELAKSYFESKEPLRSCAFCVGSVGKRIEHRQMEKGEIDAQIWTKRTIASSISQLKAFKKFTLYRLFGMH